MTDTQASRLHTEAHLLAGPVLRGSHTLTEEELEHLRAAMTYLDFILEPTYPRSHEGAAEACLRWQRGDSE